jgi:hypothetical protein
MNKQVGEILSGTKDVRVKGDDEDENNLKRPKGPLPRNEEPK